MSNLAQVVEVGRDRAPRRAALVSDGVEVTFADLHERTLQSAGTLASVGITQGQRVGVLLRNELAFPEIAFGVLAVGAVLVPINVRLSPPELRYLVEHAQLSMMIVGHDLLEGVASIDGYFDAGLTRVVVDALGDSTSPTPPGWFDWAELVAAGEPAEQIVDVDPGEDCMIVYTSGTTGRPKGAVRSHGACLDSVHSFTLIEGTTEFDSFLYAIPLASAGFFNVFAACVARSLTVDLLSTFDPAEVCDLIERRRISHTYFVPSMWDILLRSGAADRHDLSSLRCGVWGGEPMSPTLRDRVVERFGPILAAIWGATECGLTVATPGDGQRYPGTAGRASGLNQVRIIDKHGRELPRGEVGEIVNAGPGIFSRYLNDPAATAEVLRDGWYHSGDLGRMDDHGNIWVVDRKKEMLISGGQNVYPAEIEVVLREHPEVGLAAVVAKPDATWGEAPVAFIVRAPGSAVDEEGLADWCRSRLAGYKVPRSWSFVDDLPRSANGKILKHELRRVAAEQAGAMTGATGVPFSD